MLLSSNAIFTLKQKGSSALHFLNGAGSMGLLVRNFPWEKTALGAIEQWPQSLRTAAGICLHAAFPSLLCWGDEFFMIYNDAYSQLIDKKHPAALGSTVSETWPESWPVLKERFEKVYQHGESFHHENQGFRLPRNGEERTFYFTYSYSPVYDESDSIGGVCCHLIDVTGIYEEKITKEQLRYRQALLEAQNETIPDGILIVDTKGGMISCNKHFKEIWDMPQDIIDEMNDQAALEFAMTKLVDPEGFIKRVDYLYANGNEASKEEIFFKSGKIIERHGNAVIGDDGTNYGWAWYFRDISERKKMEEALRHSEQMFRSIVMQAPVGMAIYKGEDHIVEVVNDYYLSFAGKKREEVEGKPFQQVFQFFGEDDFDRILDAVLQTGQPYHSGEHKYSVQQAGKLTEMYASVLFQPLLDTKGKVSKIMAIVLDITDQVMARREIEAVVSERTLSLKETNLKLQRSNDELEQYAYVASHDLQEPLRKIKTFAGMLNDLSANAGEKEKQLLQKIMTSSERMSVLINDILNFSKLTHFEASFINTNLNQILQHVLNDLELEIENMQVRIEAGNLPGIEAIPIQMNQLFFNLIGNSLKFAKPDIPLVIRVKALEVDEERRKSFTSIDPSLSYTELVFTDNGMGFDQQYAEKIFTIFQRLNNRSYKGSGIGLALCRRIVQYHRGEIFAISTEGEGAAFHVILPVKQRS